MSIPPQPDGFQRKIKTREQLRKAVGPYPRGRTVIMCHGTFDLVHPGHIRHLMYAKDHADVLVASLTSDAHINKANFRPFVPQDLRAMNLAALECVDYVIIDDNATPIENLKFIQPDFFAKGYEYSAEGIHPRTREEMAAIESYGGELLFTPGDLVLSSSAIIETTPPNLAIEKLLALLNSEGLNFGDLKTALAKLRGIKVHVVGDTIVDTFTYCSLIGGTAKTPTFSVKYEREVDFLGGAAVVAKHLREAGADVVFSTVLGDDALKDFVLMDLDVSGIECHAITDPTRPTTQKNAFISNGYRLLKVDKLDNRPISEHIVNALKGELASHKVDVVVFSDFRHGIFNKVTIPQLAEAMPAGVMRVADSQVANRWGNILEFQDFDLITPNEREARFALGDQDSTVRPMALDLYKKAGCKVLILKLGERGMITYRAPSPEVRAFFTVDSFADRVVDPVGAGDALLSYAALSLVATKSNVISSILGALAAAVACEQDGNIPVKPEEVLKKLNALEKRSRFEMRLAVIGLGVQGRKRRAIAGDKVVTVVDPVASDVDFQRIEDVPLASYDAACVCVPDQEKFAILRHLLINGKHALVEKPLLGSSAEIRELIGLSQSKRATCYTAYNHRFEPHIAKLKQILDSESLGPIYLARFFYGNGTARDVRNSPWRDKDLGVVSDLGSHMLDMAHFLFGPYAEPSELWSADRFENNAPDHVLFGYRSERVLQMEATLLSWRNTFHLDLFGELGSAHIDCLCKWGPSTLTVRKRVLPSGRPEETVEVLEQSDPTWQLEYDHFLEVCRSAGTNLENDIWISEKISQLGELMGNSRS